MINISICSQYGPKHSLIQLDLLANVFLLIKKTLRKFKKTLKTLFYFKIKNVKKRFLHLCSKVVVLLYVQSVLT